MIEIIIPEEEEITVDQLKEAKAFHQNEIRKIDEELEKRRKAWVCPEPKVKTGYLARYAKLVSSADKGAILE